jgi:hypothetical protein
MLKQRRQNAAIFDLGPMLIRHLEASGAASFLGGHMKIPRLMQYYALKTLRIRILRPTRVSTAAKRNFFQVDLLPW